MIILQDTKITQTRIQKRQIFEFAILIQENQDDTYNYLVGLRHKVCSSIDLLFHCFDSLFLDLIHYSIALTPCSIAQPLCSIALTYLSQVFRID